MVCACRCSLLWQPTPTPTPTPTPPPTGLFRYFFQVTDGTPGRRVRLTLHLNQVAKVYNQDLRPVVRLGSKARWERLQESATFSIRPASAEVVLTFHYTFVSDEPVFFAYYYPFPYHDCQRLLKSVDTRLRRPPHADHGGASGRTSGARASTLSPGAEPGDSNLYYHRELLTRSVNGHRVELLTITSPKGMAADREPVIDGLFPDADCVRPRRFKGKPGIFVSARVVRTHVWCPARIFALVLL